MINDNTTPMKAKVYDQGIERTIPFYNTFHSQIIDIIACMQEKHQEKPLYWLDTGCGTGTLALLAGEKLSNIHFKLIDPSEQMMVQCQAKTSHLGAEYSIIPSQAIAEENTFDIVTAIQAHHYLREDERRLATQKIYTALKKGGIYLTFENAAPEDEKLISFELKRWGAYQKAQGKSEKEVTEHLARYGTQYFPITVAAHQKLLQEVGFSSIHVFWQSYMQVGIYAVK